MNILYLHGLDSSLSSEKLKALKPYGNIFYPNLDYRGNANCLDYVLDNFSELPLDAIIGSSMGGFLGYHISNALNTPALLFNPALAYRSVHQDMRLIENDKPNYKSLILGAKDTVVTPISTLDFVSHHINSNTNFNIKIRQELEHRIPIKIFEEEVKLFINKLNQ